MVEPQVPNHEPALHPPIPNEIPPHPAVIPRPNRLDANGPFPQHFEDDDDIPSEIHPRKRALSTSATSQVAKKRITKENHPPSSTRRASQPLSNPKGTSRSKGKSAAIKKTSKIPENGEGDTIIASIRWTSEERSILFAFILGPESDRMFEMLGVNPGRVFAKVS